MRFAIVDSKLIPDKLPNASNKTHTISSIDQIPCQKMNPDYPFNKELQQQLAGKQLLLDDLPFPIEEIQEHYENGCLIYRKGIHFAKNKPVCIRCGNQDKQFFSCFPCARCGEECIYCRKCIMMGRVSSCTPLISWIGPPPQFAINTPQLSWNGSLSDGQQIASTRVVQAINENKELLVWAV